MLVYIKTGSDAWQFLHRQGSVWIWALPRREDAHRPDRAFATDAVSTRPPLPACGVVRWPRILNVITETSGSAVSQLAPCRSACTQIGVH